MSEVAEHDILRGQGAIRLQFAKPVSLRILEAQEVLLCPTNGLSQHLDVGTISSRQR